MYKIGLKLWSNNTNNYLEEARRLFREGIFDYIELYVLPGTLEHLKFWKTLEIPFVIHCAHSAHRFNPADINLAENNRKIYEEA